MAIPEPNYCCEEAKLESKRAEKAEAERNHWRKEAEERLESWIKWQGRADKAEAERDEWKASAEATAKDCSGAESRVDKLIAERDKLKRELSDVIEVTGSQYNELQAKLTLQKEKLSEAEEEIAVQRRLINAQRDAINLRARRSNDGK